MNNPAVNAAGLDLVIPSSNPYLPDGEHLSPQSQPVLDIDQQAILNKLDTAGETKSGPSQDQAANVSDDGAVRQEKPGVSAFQAELQRLRPLENQLRLLPVGWGDDCKAPMLRKEDDWPTHPGFTVDQLEAMRANKGMKSTGLITGNGIIPIYCSDFDGTSSVDWGAVNGYEPWAVNTWVVFRNTDPWRLKVIFSPTADQIKYAQDQGLPNGEFTYSVRTGPKEQLEHFFHTGRQVICSGAHWASKGHYYWGDGLGPEDLAPPPDDWWEATVQGAVEHQQRKGNVSRKPSSTGKGDWRRLSQCPICGRNKRVVCQQHRDGDTIRCFRGGTFAPPEGLNPGDRVGEWGYSREQAVSWGDFAVFVRHKPRALDALRDRMVKNLEVGDDW